MHDVQRAQLRIGHQKQSRNNGKIFSHIIGNRKGGERAACHQQLLANADNFNELGGVGLKINHIAGLARGLCAGLHGHAHIGLRQSGRVIGAIAAHGDQTSALLLAPDIGELVLRCGLADKIIDTCLGGNGGSGQGIVAGDHHRFDAHGPQFGKACADIGLHNVLEVNDAQQLTIFTRRQRRAARTRDPLNRMAEIGRSGQLGEPAQGQNRIHRALAQAATGQINPRNTGLRGKGHNNTCFRGLRNGHMIPIRCQRHNRAPFRRFIRQAGQQNRFGKCGLRDALNRIKFIRHAVAKGDGAGFIEQQRVHIAGRFHSAARGGNHIEADEPVHAGNADGRKQAADGCRNQTDQQGNQHRYRQVGTGIARQRPQADTHNQKNNGQTGEQNGQRQFIRGFLPLRPFHQRNHPVNKGGAGCSRNPHLDIIRENRGAPCHSRAVTTRLADNGRGFAGDGRFIDRGQPLNNLAIAGDNVPRFHQHHVINIQIQRIDALIQSVKVTGIHIAFGMGVHPRFAQGFGLRLAAPFGNSLGKIGK